MSSDESKQGFPPLTELEGAALGTVWKRGPCSAYSVMRAFATSASSSWSASAGAVYPALRRLERLGLVVGTTTRRTRMLAVTQPGASALRLWLTIRPEMGRVTTDPVRSRMFFLDAIESAADQAAFLAAAESQTRVALHELQAALGGSSADEQGRLAAMGSAFELKARLRWLRWVKKEIS